MENQQAKKSIWTHVMWVVVGIVIAAAVFFVVKGGF